MTVSTIMVDPKIRFLISVPDWQPHEATPFQGFAFSLCSNISALRLAQVMPTDIFELTPPFFPYRLARRIAGELPIAWYGQSPRALKSSFAQIDSPFTIVILGQDEDIEYYGDELAKCSQIFTVVAKKGGHFRHLDLSVERLRSRFIEICCQLKAAGRVEGVAEAEAAISSWVVPPKRMMPYEVGGHGTITPNLAALRVCGFVELIHGPYKKIQNEEGYVDQLVVTSSSILDEREANPLSMANQIYPRSPDINIYLPSTYDLRSAVTLRNDLDPGTRREFATCLRILETQTGYSFGLTTPAQSRAFMRMQNEGAKLGAIPQLNPFIAIRQKEVWLGTEAVACLAASEISAVIRLPNRVNRTRGAVRQFAQHYRADKAQMLKRSERFKAVQDSITASIPPKFRAIIARSKDGIRIIADAHIEWMDCAGIPLGLRHNVSRIPVTPGNLFIGTLSSLPSMMVTPEDFRQILVVSGLDAEDDIAKPFRFAFDTFGRQWRDKLQLKFVRVRSKKDFVDATNAYQGMLMVFDGHGSHKPDQPGFLWFGEEAVDIWDLRGEIVRPPPIVILSACDTHAADRNHATVANGFLALGCRSVLGSVFPLHAVHAAVFAARLLFRISTFIPAAVKEFQRSLTWLEVVSGMLRRQITTDILLHLRSLGLIPEPDFENLHFHMLFLVDSQIVDPFASIRQGLLDFGIEESQLDRETRVAIAASSTISYLHLGRPETILINSVENVDEWSRSIDDMGH